MSSLIANIDDYRDLISSLLWAGHNVRFRANGQSMTPFIEDGDILEASPIGKHPLHVGEIILYEVGKSHLVVHRILHKRHLNHKLLVQTRGDANFTPDDWIDRSKILGKITSIERRDLQIRPNTLQNRVYALSWGVARRWHHFAWLIKSKLFHSAG